MNDMAEGVGQAKLILLGEHAVVHGRPALAAALDRGVHATARRGRVRVKGPRVRVPAWQVDVVPDANGDDLERAMARLFEASPSEVRDAVVDVEAVVPSRAGLGSSAALSVAVVRALAALAGDDLDVIRTEVLAGLAEEVFHGRASGIDAAVAARGGVLRFLRGAAPVAVDLGAPLPAVVAYVEPRVPTREMVSQVGAAYGKRPEEVGARFEAIGRLVDDATTALVDGALDDLGRLMNENHAELSALGLSTPTLEEACAVARSAGAVGAKLTGAGGGGCMMALAPGCESEVAAALEPLALWVTTVRLGG